MFVFACALLSPLQELDIIRRGQSPPEDNAGQVGQLLLKRFSSPFLKSTVSAVARMGLPGVIFLCRSPIKDGPTVETSRECTCTF